jgi:hypothetical protein
VNLAIHHFRAAIWDQSTTVGWPPSALPSRITYPCSSGAASPLARRARVPPTGLSLSGPGPDLPRSRNRALESGNETIWSCDPALRLMASGEGKRGLRPGSSLFPYHGETAGLRNARCPSIAVRKLP